MEYKNVPYIAFESELARMERTNHRLWLLCILLIAVLLGTNAGWLYYESQWEVLETTESFEVSTEKGHAVYNESGEVTINGESTQDEDHPNP